MDFNNIDELFNDVRKTISNNIIPKLAEEIEEVVQEESEHIYEEYTPYGSNKYNRTYDFKDRKNIESSILNSQEDITITVQNNSLAKGDNKGEFLDNYIENGIYGWSHKPPKRPFMERSAEKIQNEHIVEEIVTTTLSKKYDLE